MLKALGVSTALFLTTLVAGGAMAQEPLPSLNTSVQEVKSSSASSKEYKGTWGLSLEGKKFDSDYNQKTTSEFKLLLDGTYRPLENFSFNLVPQFSYTNGYAQTLDQTNTNAAQWTVLNASADLQATSQWKASLGALNQSAIHHRIMFDDFAFPAARITFQSSEREKFIFGARAESAVVTSSSLSTQTKEFEKTPTYQTAGFSLKAQNMVIEGDLQALMFEFNNLPTSLASQSAKLGNTTEMLDADNSTFTYEFKGYQVAGQLKAHLGGKFAVGFKGSWLENQKAPKNFNQGSVIRGFMDLRMTRNVMMTPYYEYFRIEPDATVASFNGVDLNTNRVGYRGGLGFEYKKKIKFSISGGERDVLFLSPWQERERTWSLKLETFNVAI